MPENAEQLQPHMIIVIHPGSLNLRIGRASDLNPFKIVNCLARRRKPNGFLYRDSYLPSCIEKSKELIQEIEEVRLQISHTLQSCLQSDGRRRYATPPQQIAAFNKKSQPEIIEEIQTDVKEPIDEVLFGEEALGTNYNGFYNLHFPIKRGELNLHSEIGGSLFAILNDLQCIWEYVLTKKLNIKLCDLHQYKAVLVIPDIYNRSHLKELTSLLLTKIGFGSCFLVQDNVAATFGAGLGYACVVDVGDQKISVSCIEDGISHPSTRVKLDYGGGDVTQSFYWLLQRSGFPFKNLNLKKYEDVSLLKNLKKEFCHVNLDICGPQEKDFTVKDNNIILKYTIQVGDEAIVAPLSLFHTELLSVTGKFKIAKVQKPCVSQPDSEDCFDSSFIRETGRKSGREQMEQTEGGMLMPNDNQDDDIIVDSLEVERDLKPNDKEFVIGGQIVGIDQAILQSIERCPTDELKRKMYGCILIVGGGMKFDGIEKWLQNRLALQIPYMHRSEQLDIVTSTNMDNAMTVWKGAAIMSCLESAPELWITSLEWNKYGLRILREKAPFMW